jgi:hypothetical protein
MIHPVAETYYLCNYIKTLWYKQYTKELEDEGFPDRHPRRSRRLKTEMFQVGSKAQLRWARRDLEISLVTASVRFVVTVTATVEPLFEAAPDRKYPRLFSDGAPKSVTSPLDQVVLAEEGASFFLHALSRFSFRNGSEGSSDALFSPSMRNVARTFGGLIAAATERGSKSIESEILDLASRRGSEYGQKPSLLGDPVKGAESVVSLAGKTIANSVGCTGDTFVEDAIENALKQALAGSALESHVGLIEVLSM